jgi:DNA modification methylase
VTVRILHGDCREVLCGLPDESVQCIVTSPPYWSLRDYGVAGQIGLEAGIEEHVEVLVGVFREVRRVLRADGVLWLNLGDTYIGAPHGGMGSTSSINGRPEIRAQRTAGLRTHSKRGLGLKPKDMVGMPWRVALAMQADGWWLRGDVVWHKPNPQPEAVLDRPTRSHEFIFQLTKSERYFFDAEAIKEPVTGGAHSRGHGVNPKAVAGADTKDSVRDAAAVTELVEMRNARSVWTIPTHPFREAHSATFPPELAERCILAGTGGRGCCSLCGRALERIIESETASDGRPQLGERTRSPARLDAKNQQSNPPAGIRVASATVGWRHGCECEGGAVVPCTVLDPFGGAGTTGLVADRLGRDAILIELNPEYAEMAERRLRGDSPLFAEVARS